MQSAGDALVVEGGTIVLARRMGCADAVNVEGQSRSRHSAKTMKSSSYYARKAAASRELARLVSLV